MKAINTNDLPALSSFIEQGHIFKLKDGNGFTALNYAICCGKADAVALLLAAGMDPNNADISDCTPIFDAIVGKQSCHEMVDLLIAAGAHIDHQSSKLGITPLMVAVYKADEAMVNKLLALGANVNAADIYGVTPLMVAAHYGHTQIR